jgi:hypothetical protein
MQDLSSWPVAWGLHARRVEYVISPGQKKDESCYGVVDFARGPYLWVRYLGRFWPQACMVMVHKTRVLAISECSG